MMGSLMMSLYRAIVAAGRRITLRLDRYQGSCVTLWTFAA